MKVAIYSRKSVFTGKGESIENQVQMCKDHYLRNYPDNNCEFEVFEDEGYTGSNTKRPQFQKLLSEIRQNKFNALICYRLDRISRNVADFSSILELLQAHNVSFISIKEQFDTSTPIGKAMVYIASVFAQLERDTIAERVRDNMLQLAKTGRWLGGQTPLGFKSERISYFDAEMKERSLYKLSPIKEELKIVQKIFNNYVLSGSRNYVLKDLMINNIKGKKGGTFHSLSISDILRNPVYVKSDNKVKNYLESKGIQFCGVPNGHGIILYNKKMGKLKFNPMEKWIAAVAKHDGIIDSADWLTAQRLLDTTSENYKKNKIRLGSSRVGILTGVIRCAKCGHAMRITYGHVNKSGKRDYYYCCNSKCITAKEVCNNPNANGPVLEREVMKALLNYDKNVLKEKLKKLLQNEKQINCNSNSRTLNYEIESLENDINNLMEQLAKTKNKTTQEFLLKKADELSSQLDELKKRADNTDVLKENTQKDIDNLNIVIESFDDFTKLYSSITDLASIDDDTRLALKNLIARLVSKISFDGDTNDVEIDIWGSPKKKITNDDSFFIGGMSQYDKDSISMSNEQTTLLPCTEKIINSTYFHIICPWSN